jgi:hypothetical protein
VGSLKERYFEQIYGVMMLKETVNRGDFPLVPNPVLSEQENGIGSPIIGTVHTFYGLCFKCLSPRVRKIDVNPFVRGPQFECLTCGVRW